MTIIWQSAAWADYTAWLEQDGRIAHRINRLIADTSRHGAQTGVGKPEPLKWDLSGWWSRRITDEHRLINRTTVDAIEIAACRYHYS